jgi:hypothetical protein
VKEECRGRGGEERSHQKDLPTFTTLPARNLYLHNHRRYGLKPSQQKHHSQPLKRQQITSPGKPYFLPLYEPIRNTPYTPRAIASSTSQ